MLIEQITQIADKASSHRPEGVDRNQDGSKGNQDSGSAHIPTSAWTLSSSNLQHVDIPAEETLINDEVQGCQNS